MAAGNTELCEIINVEPEVTVQSMPYALEYRELCTVHVDFLKDDIAENKKYISSVLDLFSIPNFYIRKGRPHGQRYGKAPGCKEYHTANQLAKKCRKKKYDSIHDRFIRDKTFRKTMIEVGRPEKDHPLRWIGLQAKIILTTPPEQKLTSTVETGGFTRTW